MSSNVQKTDPHEYELENEFIKGKLEVIDQVKQFIDDDVLRKDIETFKME